MRKTLPILLLLATLPALAADAPAPGTAVVKLITTSSDNGATYLIVTPPEGGRAVRLLCVGDAKTRASSLYTERGELITVTVKPANGPGTDSCTAVAPYAGPKGMKSPRAWQFESLDEKKSGQLTLTVVKLSRFGQSKEAVLPNRPGIAGAKPAPDPATLELLKSLAPGDVVEAEFARGGAGGVPRDATSLLDVDKYREPQLGEFVKTDTIKEGNKSIPAIVLSVDDTPQTVALPAAPLRLSESSALAMLRKIRPGQYVRFTTRDLSGRPTLRELSIDGHMEPVSDTNVEFLSTFIRVHFYVYGADVDIYFYPRSGRPEDQLLEKGLRRVAYSPTEARKVGLTDAQVTQIKTALNDRFTPTDSDDMMAKEKMPWVKAYRAYAAARDDATRAQVEQQMAFAAQDFSTRFRKDIEAKYAILKALVDTNQLEAIKALGKKSPGNSD